MRARLAVLGVAAVGLLAGCADVVDGSGALAGGAGASGSSSPDFPGQSGAPNGSSGTAASPAPSTGSVATSVPPPTPCPHVSFAGAKLSFDCLESDFEPSLNGPIWPLRESKEVEAKTHWVVEEGAGHWGPPGAHTLSEITKDVRQQMVDAEGYGLKPTVSTIDDEDTTVDGANAHLLHSKMTLDPAWVRTQKVRTAVKQEQLWIVAITVGPNDVSLWYASVPDLASALWAKVPSIIKTIKVG